MNSIQTPRMESSSPRTIQQIKTPPHGIVESENNPIDQPDDIPEDPRAMHLLWCHEGLHLSMALSQFLSTRCLNCGDCFFDNQSQKYHNSVIHASGLICRVCNNAVSNPSFHAFLLKQAFHDDLISLFPNQIEMSVETMR